MRIVGVIALALGGVGVVVGVLLVLGNPDLSAPGPRVLPFQAYEVWRAALAIVLWAAAVLLAVGILAVTRQPGAAWLILLAFIPLIALYLAGGALMPTFALAMTAVVVLGVALPVVVGMVGVAIGSAVRRRKVSAASA